MVYVRVQLVGAENVKVQFEQNQLDFSAQAQQQDYQFQLQLNQEIIPEQSRYRVLGQDVEILMKKKDQKVYWYQLNKGGKLGYVRIDWDKWQEEDDDETENSKLPEFGGIGESEMPNLDQFKLPENEDHCCDEHCHCHDQNENEEKDTEQQQNNEQIQE